MRLIRTGSRRWVFLFEKFVIKIPRLNSWVHFLYGVMENLHERSWWCTEAGYHDDESRWNKDDLYRHLGKVIYADRFGLCLVMRRYYTLDELLKGKIAVNYQQSARLLNSKFRNIKTLSDVKPDNVMWAARGTPVLVDYGYFDAHGCPWHSIGIKRGKPLSRRS